MEAGTNSKINYASEKCVLALTNLQKLYTLIVLVCNWVGRIGRQIKLRMKIWYHSFFGGSRGTDKFTVCSFKEKNYYRSCKKYQRFAQILRMLEIYGIANVGFTCKRLLWNIGTSQGQAQVQATSSKRTSACSRSSAAPMIWSVFIWSRISWHRLPWSPARRVLWLLWPGNKQWVLPPLGASANSPAYPYLPELYDDCLPWIV